MAEEQFVLVSLKDDQAKKLTLAISNDTARKILDHLSKVKDSTETDIAKGLGLPLSTIHYNLSNLVKADLVLADEYHYSRKGKEILHYSLAKKLIIIAPRESKGLRKRLSKFLPLGMLLVGASLVLRYISRPEQAMLAAMDAVPEAMLAAPLVIQETGPSIALWFLYGGLFAMAMMLVFELVWKK